jgi:phosphate-selective porin
MPRETMLMKQEHKLRMRLYKKSSALIATVALVIAGASSEAAAGTLEDLLVEKGVITKAQAQGVTSAGGTKVYYKGGTRFEFPDSGLTTRFNTQIQARYTFTDRDNADNTSSFDMRRVRLIMAGSALHNEFEYVLQADFVGTRTEDGTRAPDLRDGYIQWNPTDDVGVRMGQYKVFVSRQENTSSSKLQFTDRSVASDLFQLGRQAGLSGRFEGMDGRLFAAAGIFNGESDGEGRNRPGVDNNHTGAVTVRYTAMGTMDAMEEGDVNHTEEASLNFGAAYAFGEVEEALAKADKHTISADASFKSQGFSVHGEFFYRMIDPDMGGSDSDIEPLAFYVQAGYFLIPKEFEIAARYAFVDCDDGAFAEGACEGNEKVNQVTAGLNYYFMKHSLKAQLNWEWTEGDALDIGVDDKETNRIVFQVSSYL